MKYLKNQDVGIDIIKATGLILQISVVADAVIGFDPKFYVISKACILIFILLTCFDLFSRKDIYIGKSIIIPLFFVVVTICSFIWSEYPNVVLHYLLSQTQLYILFFCTYLFVLNNNFYIKKYMDALLIAGICMAILALYRYGLGGIISGLNEGKRIGRAITNENVFGIVFARATLVSFYYSLKSDSGKKKMLYLIFVVVFTLFAFSSGSKKAFLIVLGGIIGINAFENGLSKIWKTLFVSVLVIFCIFFILQLPLFATINTRIMDFFAGQQDNSEMVRARMINLSMQLFYEKPLLGHGLKTFGTITGLGTYSHNNMTEILVSTGIIGFIFFYFPYLQIIVWGWIDGIKANNYINILFLLLAMINLIFGYAMVEFYDKEYWVFAGIMMACLDRDYLISDGVFEYEKC